MTSFLVIIAALGWSLFLIQRYSKSDALKMPELFSPITAEERKALDDLVVARDECRELLVRLNLAEVERNRIDAQWRSEVWSLKSKLRRIRREVETVGEPALEPELETCERAG